MYNICIVEDEKELNNILTLYLSREGFNITSCVDLSQATKSLNSKIDLWIVDIMLPDGTGFELLRKIRLLNKYIPIILISARGDDLDKVLGLEMGCDDYIAKPFLPRELVLRSKKLLERFYEFNKVDNSIVDTGNYVINLKTRLITYKDKLIDLTAHEYDIILYFIENKSIALSRDTILNNIWGNNYFGSDRVVDNAVKKIRKKLPLLNIETIYGYGYRCNL